MENTLNELIVKYQNVIDLFEHEMKEESPSQCVESKIKTLTGVVKYLKKLKNQQAFANLGNTILNDLLNHSEEIIAHNGIRFNGVHDKIIKQVFEKHGIKYETPF